MDSSKEPLIGEFPEPAVVAGAYQEVIDYNQKNTGFGGIFSAILETTVEAGEAQDSLGPDADARDIYKAVRRKMDASRDEADIRADLAVFSSDGLMSKIGLRFDSSGSTTVDGKGERVAGREIEPIIDSPSQFAGFLATLDTKSIEEHPQLSSMAISAASVLRRTVEATFQPQYEVPEAITHGEELQKIGEASLATYIKLEPEYERLNLSKDPNCELLEKYIEYWGKEILPEFIVANNTGVLKEVSSEGFGPSRWQRDATAKYLEGRWTDVVNAIKLAKTNPNGADFAQQLLDKARDHLSYARQDWAQMKQQDGGEGYDYGEGFDKVFEDTAAQFDKLAA